MSYVKTNWQSGDKIASANLNHIEDTLAEHDDILSGGGGTSDTLIIRIESDPESPDPSNQNLITSTTCGQLRDAVLQQKLIVLEFAVGAGPVFFRASYFASIMSLDGTISASATLSLFEGQAYFAAAALKDSADDEPLSCEMDNSGEEDPHFIIPLYVTDNGGVLSGTSYYKGSDVITAFQNNKLIFAGITQGSSEPETAMSTASYTYTIAPVMIQYINPGAMVEGYKQLIITVQFGDKTLRASVFENSFANTLSFSEYTP